MSRTLTVLSEVRAQMARVLNEEPVDVVADYNGFTVESASGRQYARCWKRDLAEAIRSLVQAQARRAA